MTAPPEGLWFPDGAASRAVLIGASGFRSRQLPDIPAVRANLLGLQRALSYPGLGTLPREHCVVLGEPKDPAAVGSTLAEAGRKAVDLLLVYYAGHGLLDDDGLLHLALPSTDPDNVGYTAIPLELIKRDVGKVRARVRVLILDCCFSGQAVAAMATPASVVAGQLGLTGTYVLTSTTATAPSHAAPGARYTAFTGALLHALGSPKPLSLNGIYRQVDAELAGLGLPRPQRRSANTAADLVLVRGPIPADDPPKATVAPTYTYPVTARPSSITGNVLFFLAFVGYITYVLSQVSPTAWWAFALCLVLLLMVFSGLSSVAPRRLELGKEALVVRGPQKKVRVIKWTELARITLRAPSRGTPPGRYTEVTIVRRNSRPKPAEVKMELKDVVVSMTDLADALRAVAPTGVDIRQVISSR